MVIDDATTLKNMQLEPGWFRFSTSTADVYECPSPPNCVGGRLSFNSSLLGKNSLCRKGSMGPLCSICSKEYYLSQSEGCLTCEVGNQNPRHVARRCRSISGAGNECFKPAV